MIFSATLQAGFLAVVLFVADPFHRLDIPVIDGVGLSPILRHPAMLVHPPLLYAGQVIAIVLGVRTMAELVASGRLGPDWSGWSRRWALGAAGVTGAALGLGGWWAYAELGWGGFWAWDPVENAGLLPWLAAIMVVHALVGGAQRVAAVLAMVAGGFALAGGALTRSGVGISVHSFTPNRAVGRALTAILIAFAVCAVVAVATMRKTNPKGFAAAPRVRTLATRKLVIPVATVLFLATTIVVAMGTGVPLLFGDRVTTAAFYSGFTGPIALVAVAGVGIGPLAFRGIRVIDRAMIVAFGWGVISGGVIAVSTGSPFAALTAALTPPSLLGLVRSGRRSRAMLAHVGAIALLVGIAGTTAGHDTSGWLRVGESKAVAGWTATLRGVDAVRGEDRERIVATVDVSGPGRKATVRPSADRWDGWTGPLAETASITSSGTHVQVVLRRVLDDPTTALIDVHVRPLLPLVWFGAFLLSVGTLVGLRRRAQPTSH